MADIFLSYAREDIAVARQLAQALEKEGWSVFWDRRIPPGRRWSEYIEEQLSSARCLITLWSKSSAVSDWVLEEAEVGKERGILVPALLDSGMVLPMGFRRIHAADLADWRVHAEHEGYRELVAAIGGLAPPTALKAEPVRETPDPRAGSEIAGIEEPVEPSFDEMTMSFAVSPPPAPPVSLEPETRPNPEAAFRFTPTPGPGNEGLTGWTVDEGNEFGYPAAWALLRNKRFLMGAAGVPALALAGWLGSALFQTAPTPIPAKEDRSPTSTQKVPENASPPAKGASEAKPVETRKNQEDRSAASTRKVPENTSRPGKVANEAKPLDLRINPIDQLAYVWIPSGGFEMGCSAGDKECKDNEKPPHRVQLTRGFWIGQTEVTQAAFERVMGTKGVKNPSHFRGDENLPVDSVTWEEAKNYCGEVGGQLPTEAQWEYAARAGSQTARYGDLDRIAWFDGNSGLRTRPVGRKVPNHWGLYDSLGNVLEWTVDYEDFSYYLSRPNPDRDPINTKPGEFGELVLRGGSWNHDPRYLRVSTRYGIPSTRPYPFPQGVRFNYVGFRCTREAFP